MIILLAVLALETSLAEPHQIEINYDKRVELFMTIYLLATKESQGSMKASLPMQQVIHPLGQAVIDYFQKYSKHPAVRLCQQIKSHLTIEDLITLALYHSEPPRLNQQHDYPYLLTWKLKIANLYPKEIRSFIKALAKFYKKSKFEKFWLKHLPEYEEIVSQARKSYEELNIVKLVEDYYGMPVSVKLKCIVSPLIRAGFMFSHKVGAEATTYYVMGSSIIGDSSFVPIPATYFMDRVLDEFGHSYVDSLAAKYHQQLDEMSWLYNSLNRQDIMTKKLCFDWSTCWDEHVVRAIKARIYLAQRGKEEAIKLIIKEEEEGFKLISFLYNELEKYERNRTKYGSFASFYPVLLGSLDNLEPTNKPVPVLKVLTHQKGRHVVIDFVYPKSAAQQAGLEVGDTILGIDGVAIRSEQQLQSIISKKKMGSTAKILIARAGVKYEIPVSIDYEYPVFSRKQVAKPPKPRRRTYY